MHCKVHPIVLAFTLVLAPLVLTGCKGEVQVDVKGRVTYNGKPLGKQGGQIVFVGPQGTQVVSSIGADGSYLANKVPTGPNRVAVYYPNPDVVTGKKVPVRPQKGKPPPPVTPAPAPPAFLTPIKYASVDTSKLEVRVEAGTVFDADLIGPKMPR